MRISPLSNLLQFSFLAFALDTCIVVPAMRISPIAHIPADQTSKRELTQKKLIDCPISSHDPDEYVDSFHGHQRPDNRTYRYL